MNRRIYWILGSVAAVLIVAVAIALTTTDVATGGGDDEGDDSGPITGEALERASEAALAHTGEGRVTETELDDEESYYEVEVTLDDGSQVDVQLDEQFNVVGDEQEEEDDDEGEDDVDDDSGPITGEALDRASEAALAHTGGGRVTDTEVGDEESYYEVEVTLDDGSQVDVQLDEDFNVVGDEVDDADDDDDDDD
jgi:uncharacterized membrane protein YkoI